MFSCPRGVPVLYRQPNELGQFAPYLPPQLPIARLQVVPAAFAQRAGTVLRVHHIRVHRVEHIRRLGRSGRGGIVEKRRVEDDGVDQSFSVALLSP